MGFSPNISRARKRWATVGLTMATVLVASALTITPAPVQALGDTGTGGVFVPTSGRAYDTGSAGDTTPTPMAAGVWRTIKIAGKAGIPDDGSAGAVSLEATILNTPGPGQLSGRPNSSAGITVMSKYNFGTANDTSNSAILALDDDGTIQVRTDTAARLVLDVQGYYTSNDNGTAAGGFVPVTGTRIVDSRSGLGVTKSALVSGDTKTVQVTGTAGIPVGASGVVVTMIALNTQNKIGALTPFAYGAARPQNTFHYQESTETALTAQVPLSANGKLSIYNTGSITDLVLDIQGYFTAAGKGGAVFTPAAGRAYDSRDTSGVAGGETRDIQLAGVNGVPVVGSGVTAVVVTLTAIHSSSGDGRATVYASGATRPGTTSIDFSGATTRTNSVTVPIGANGKVSIYSVGDPTHYLIDIQGWYTNPVAPRISCPQPYTAGSWTALRPTSGVTCTVSFPPSSESQTQGIILLDGTDYDSVDLSATANTQTTVAMDYGGSHLLQASTSMAPALVVAYSFGFGNWSSSSLQPEPASGSVVVPGSSLGVDVADDGFPSGATFRYLISSTSDMRAVVYDSGSVTGAIDLPSNLIVNGATYFWTVAASGITGGTAGYSTLQSDIWSFSVDSSSESDNGETLTDIDDTTYAVPDDELTNDPNSDLYLATTDATYQASGSPNSPSPTQTAALGSKILPADWKPCGYKQEGKLVKEYPRLGARDGSHKTSGGFADFRCGTQRYGYFHVLEGKQKAWTNMAFGTGVNWRDLASWSAEWVLQDPDNRVYVPKQAAYKTPRWCYSRIVYLRDNKSKEVIKEHWVRVIMGETGVRVISMYPADKKCTSKTAG